MANNLFKGKKVIIFDLDGTIIDSVGIWNDVDAELIKKIGGTPDENIFEFRSKILHEQNQGNIYLNYMEALKEKYNSDLTKEEMYEMRYEIAYNYLVNKLMLKPNVDKVILMLKQLGYSLAIATTTPRKNIDIYSNENKNINSKIDFKAIFEIILTKDDVVNKKPHPEVLLKCAEYFNVEPSECLVIEDEIIGVQAAKNANMDVIAIYDKYSDKDVKEIKKIANLYIKDYNELIGTIEGIN